MKKVFILLILMVFISPAYAATIYRWVDEKDVVNFTDDYNRVPLAFHNRVEKEYLQEDETPTPAQEMVAKSKEEIRTDIYGQDETYWRKKVRPWREQLEEATKNYEKAQEEFVKQGEGLGPFRFGGLSLTQYQMISSRLDALNDQMGKYQAQIAEAKEMSEKLSKEAIETKADPAWLE